MDGNTIDLDPRTAEAMRQDAVYQNAMASLQLEARQREALEDAVMAPGYGLSHATENRTRIGRMAGLSQLFLVALGGGIVNYLFYAFVLNG